MTGQLHHDRLAHQAGRQVFGLGRLLRGASPLSAAPWPWASSADRWLGHDTTYATGRSL